MFPRIRAKQGVGSKTSKAPFRIKTYGLSSDPTSGAYLNERIGFKLGKFATHVQGLEVRLRNASPSQDPPLVSCLLFVEVDAGEPLVVERFAMAAREAFDHAVGVAERMLRRRFQRLRHAT